MDVEVLPRLLGRSRESKLGTGPLTIRRNPPVGQHERTMLDPQSPRKGVHLTEVVGAVRRLDEPGSLGLRPGGSRVDDALHMRDPGVVPGIVARHDSASGRSARGEELDPETDVVIFGHHGAAEEAAVQLDPGHVHAAITQGPQHQIDQEDTRQHPLSVHPVVPQRRCVARQNGEEASIADPVHHVLLPWGVHPLVHLVSRLPGGRAAVPDAQTWAAPGPRRPARRTRSYVVQEVRPPAAGGPPLVARRPGVPGG